MQLLIPSISKLKFSCFLVFQKQESADDKVGSYNKAYVHSSMPLIPEYQDILEDYYKATVMSNITEGVTGK